MSAGARLTLHIPRPSYSISVTVSFQKVRTERTSSLLACLTSCCESLSDTVSKHLQLFTVTSLKARAVCPALKMRQMPQLSMESQGSVPLLAATFLFELRCVTVLPRLAVFIAIHVPLSSCCVLLPPLA